MREDLVFALQYDESGMVRGVRMGNQQFQKLDDQLDRTRKKSSQLGDVMKTALGNALANAASTAAVAIGHLARKGIDVLSESIQAAGIQQIAERKLDQALLNLGDASEESREKLAGIASEASRFSNFGDEAILTAQAMLLSFRGLGGAEGVGLLVPRLADAAAGIARVTGETTDLNQVAAALGKATTSGAGALTRYGISLSEAEREAFNAAEGLDKVRILTEILDNNFQGLAAATIDTSVQMNNAIGDIEEKIGEDLRPEVEGLQRQFTAFLQDDRTLNFAQKTGAAVVELGRKTIRFFQFSIPIAYERFKSSLADLTAETIEKTGKVISFLRNPIGALKGAAENPFQSTIDSLKETAQESKALEADLIQLELKQSAAALTAEHQAAEFKKLAGSTATAAEAQYEYNLAREETLKLSAAQEAIQQTQNPQVPEDIVLDADPLDLGDPLEVFAPGSLGAVNDAIGQLQHDIEHVDSQGARNELLALLEDLEGVRDNMLGVENTFQLTSSGSVESLQDLSNAVIDTAGQVIQAKLAEAIAGAIGAEFLSKGLLGAATSAGASAAVVLVFNKLAKPLLPGRSVNTPGGGSSFSMGGDVPADGVSPSRVVIQPAVRRQKRITVKVTAQDNFTPSGDLVRSIVGAVVEDGKAGRPGTFDISA